MTGTGGTNRATGARRPLPLDELGPLLAEPTRLRLLQELLGGTPLPAGALAARLGVAPSSASEHLARLRDAGLIRVEAAGRARLASIVDAEVADAVEAVLRLAGEAPVASLSAHDRRTAMRTARSCYDHLAGRLGVGITDLALARGWIVDDEGAWTVPSPDAVAHGLGLRLRVDDSRRPIVRACADWTERRPHLAGRLGRAVLDGLLEAGWVARRRDDRALTIRPLGRERLAELGVEL